MLYIPIDIYEYEKNIRQCERTGTVTPPICLTKLCSLVSLVRKSCPSTNVKLEKIFHEILYKYEISSDDVKEQEHKSILLYSFILL